MAESWETTSSWWTFGGATGLNLLEQTATATLKVTKGSQSAPAAPTKSSVTTSSITLTQLGTTGQGQLQYGYESSEDTSPSHWQTETTFTGLNAATKYTFYTRYIGNNYYNEAVSANGTELYTMPETPTVAISDYVKETLSTTAAMEYSTDGGSQWTDCTATMTATGLGWSGTAKTVQFRVKAVTDGAPASAAQSVTIPARPAAPQATGFTVTQPSTIQGSGSMSGITTAMEYSTDNGKSWATGSGSAITGISGGTTCLVRMAAVADTSFKSANYSISIDAFVPQKEQTPDISIDYNAKTLNGFGSSGSYSIGENTVAPNAEGALTIESTWFGTTLSIVKKGNATTTVDSDAQPLPVPSPPDAPTGLQGVNTSFAGELDGKITGLTAGTAYQISNDSGSIWVSAALTGTEITGLAAGAYQVRKAATESTFASRAADVTIGSGAERTYTLNIAAPTFAAVTYGYTQPEAGQITITSTGNSDATISSVALSGLEAACFTLIPGSSYSVMAGGSNTTWKIQPSGDLAVGTYPATITVTYNGGAAATADVSFTVNSSAQAAPAAPVEKSKTYNSVTLETVTDNANGAKAQYSKDGCGTWQDSPEFTGLTASTKYSFVVRYAATGNYADSPASAATEITTASVPSGSSYTPPAYRPDVEQPKEGGTVTVTPVNPERGDKVTITTKPEAGHEVDKITVTDKDGNPVKVNDNGDGTFSFTQPASKVKIEVTYKLTETKWVNPFTDVPEGAWYYDSVAYVVAKGLFNGTSETKFSPNATMTRAILMTVLARADGQDTANNGGQWYDVGMKWAVAQGISDGTNPDGNITREQLATMLWRYAGSPETAGTLAGYTDANTAGSYATESLKWAVEQGIISGKGNGILDPKGLATRAQVAAMLMRFMTET